MSRFFAERSRVQPIEMKSIGYQALNDASEDTIALSVQTSGEIFESRLLRIRRKVLENASITSLYRSIGWKDISFILISGGLSIGATFAGKASEKLRQACLEAEKIYTQEPQSLLGNATCAASAPASTYGMCRGKGEKTEAFIEACGELLDDICDYDISGLGILAFILGVSAAGVFYYTCYSQYQALKNNLFLRLSTEDIEFLFQYNVFTDIDSGMTITQFQRRIDSVLSRVRFHEEHGPVFISHNGDLGIIADTINQYLDPEDSQKFQSALGV